VDESVKRGYGPVCWAKIRRGETEAAILIPTPFLLEPESAEEAEERLWEGSESNPKNRPIKEAEG